METIIFKRLLAAYNSIVYTVVGRLFETKCNLLNFLVSWSDDSFSAVCRVYTMQNSR